MLIVADSGSTKADWCAINKEGVTFYFQTEGYNPCLVSREYVLHSMKKALPEDLQTEIVEEVFFYGAGCYPESCQSIQASLVDCFPNATVAVELDLLAAARALLGNKPGFAAILGTGTNTCLFDGNRIDANIDSLGYILGDEGSGASIGKKLLSAYARGYLPKEVETLFRDQYSLSALDIINRVYTQPFANRYCASFCPFVYQHIQNNFLAEIVRECFREFFSQLVSHYEGFTSYRFNCIGSVGFAFKDILAEVAREFKMKMGQVLKAPIQNLVEYHTGVLSKNPI